MATKKPIAAVAATTTTVTVTVVAVEPINHDGVLYAVGDEIDVTPDQAQALVALGSAELVAPVPPG